ncbi:MAG TPA: hypothetical protein VL588_09895, partial [Bdellovibrionota bacterium]|nr:hypothetical protein [Bdellovibrionota bacterium]
MFAGAWALAALTAVPAKATVTVTAVAPYVLDTQNAVFYAGVGAGTSNTLTGGFVDTAASYRLLDITQ